MSEQYNQIFVFAAKLSGPLLSTIIVDELAPLWEVLGAPSHLMTLNVEEGIEKHTSVDVRIDEGLLQSRPGTIFSVRGAENRMGTVQYYELAKYGVLSVSRPLRLLSFQQRVDWIRLLWSRLQSRGVILGIAGRELEISNSVIETAIRNWADLRAEPLIEFLVLSESLASRLPANAVPIEQGVLIQLQFDASGGEGTH